VKILNFFDKLFILVLIFCQTSASYSEWFETRCIQVGNSGFSLKTNQQSYFYRIPNSHFILYSTVNGWSITLFDMQKGKFRDNIVRNKDMLNPVVIEDLNSGWNIYFSYGFGKLGKLYLNSRGEFGQEVLMENTYDAGSSIELVGINNRREIWFIGNKIHRYKLSNANWEEFIYPDEWDSNFKSLEIFLTENEDFLFIYSKSNTTAYYQLVLLNLLTGETKSVTPPEENFFKSIKDIKKWNEHEGSFLILKKDSLSSYNILTGDIENHITINSDVSGTCSQILQNNTGKLVYFFNNYLGIVKDFGKDFFIHNIEDNSFTQQTYAFDDYWNFSLNCLFLDNTNNRILTTILHNPTFDPTPTSEPAALKPVFIDLNDYSVSVMDVSIGEFIDNDYFPSESLLVTSLTSKSTIELVNFNKEESITSIKLGYCAEFWSVTKDLEIFSNSVGSEFCVFDSNYRNEFRTTGYPSAYVPQAISLFPDAKSALIVMPGQVNDPNKYLLFFLDANYSNEINLSFYPGSFILDNSNNQVISAHYYFSKFDFIKQNGQVYEWSSSISGNFNIFHDEDNNYLWVSCLNDEQEIHFFKISTITYEEESKFIITPDSEITGILRQKIHPSQNYMYLIVNDNSFNRKFLVLDIIKQQIVKSILLQDNVSSKSTVIPGIVLIPEKKVIFLWDHYGGWYIDSESFEILYGEVLSNPPAESDGSIHVDGFWDPDKDRIVIADLSYESLSMEQDDTPKRILEIDLNNGFILKEIKLPDDYITSMFFPVNKKSIKFFSPLKSRTYTLHLNPNWDTPATITPSTNYIQFGEGDEAKFSVNIKNEYEFSQDVTAYMWLYAPDGTMLFFDGSSLTTNISGIPLTLPANLDITGDILTFTMPAGVPEGFYNFNAFFVNERFDRGPVGTWNFYVKD